MENLANEYGRRGVWLSPAKHRSEYCQGAQKQPPGGPETFRATWVPVSPTA